MGSAPPLRLGLFGVGLEAYWPQFPGLKERLEGYLARVAAKLGRPGVEVVNLGLVDGPERAYAAGREFRRADVDAIFLHVTTYALSSTVLPVVVRAKVPVIVLNLAPSPAIDYAAFNRLGDRAKMTSEWLAHCSACPVPEIANVFRRAGIPFHQVTGVLDNDPAGWSEIDGWVEAGRVAAAMYGHRLGLMGHYYHGKVGRGLSVEMAVRHGPVTLLSVVERPDGHLCLLCAEAESVPGPILEIGNTNSRYRFACGAREFVTRWNAQAPAHHCAVGIGHLGDRIQKLGALLGLETIRVV